MQPWPCCGRERTEKVAIRLRVFGKGRSEELRAGNKRRERRGWGGRAVGGGEGRQLQGRQSERHVNGEWRLRLTRRLAGAFLFLFFRVLLTR